MSRRFYPQFRLWHLIVVMSLACVALAWVADLRQRRARQDRALRVVQMHGGMYDAYVTSPWREWVAGGPVDRQLTVRFLALHRDAWGPFGLHGELVKMRQWEPKAFPQVRQALADLPGITTLAFDRSRLRNYTGELIVDSPRITQLTLSETGVRSADLTVLARLPNLRQLSLRRTSTGDDGLRHVAQLADLEWLDLSSTDVTDEGMSHIARLTKLKTLRLENTRLTDDGLRALSSLRGLEDLELGVTLVTAESLPLLAAMKFRTRLNLPGEWPPEAVDALRKSLPPSCQVGASPYLLRNRDDAKARRGAN